MEIVKKDLRLKKEKRAKEKQAAINRARNIAKTNGENIIATSINADNWYFNNPNQQSRGRNEFTQKWGDRALEDNWRRSIKSSSTPYEEVTSESLSSISEATGEEDTAPDIETEARKLMSPIPTTEDEKEKMLIEVEDALYSLGNIYSLRLNEDDNAIDSFESLLIRFPSTEYEDEALYQLYLLYKKINPVLSKERGDTLKEKHPESLFSKLVDNPNYREESFATITQLKKLYKRLYSQYQNGDYKEVIYSSDSTIQIHPEKEFSDNIALLRVLAIGQTEEDHKYQFELDNFAKLYPNSDLLDYSISLAKASENFQQERYNSAKARFIKDFDQKHFFVVLYDIKQELIQELPKTVDEFLEKNNLSTLKTGNLILSDEKSMLLVNDFTERQNAQEFLSQFTDQVSLKEQFKGERFDIFVITEDNFNIFYKTKDVSAYLNFFENNY